MKSSCMQDIARVMADVRKQALAVALQLPQSYAEVNEALKRTAEGCATPEDEAAGKKWGEAMRRNSERGGIIFAGWKILLDVMIYKDVRQWHGSASLYPRGRCSTEADWGHLSWIVGATTTNEIDTAHCDEQIREQLRTKHPNAVHHWSWAESVEPVPLEEQPS